MTTSKKTIVYFHTGRGGRFYNGGHKTFHGSKNISEVLQMNDTGKRHSYLTKENYLNIYERVKNLDNLRKLLEDCQDNNDFAPFKKRTGLELGEDIYTDCNGVQIITAKEVESGVGTLNWDYEYDTDECIFLSDCDENDLKLIEESNEWNRNALIEEYFNDNTDLNIDWSKFNGNYIGLIEEYFNFPDIQIEDFYK